MDVHRPEHARARVDERVGHIRRRDDHIAGASLDPVVADGEGRLPLLDDERLGVRMAMEARPLAGFRVEKENETGASWVSPSKR